MFITNNSAMEKRIPVSNKPFKRLDRETGKWVDVPATPTPKAEYKEYASRKGFKRKGYNCVSEFTSKSKRNNSNKF
jgi:hypothetical protein